MSVKIQARCLKLIGHFHLLVTAAMICGGLVMYPIGWDNREVRESCGKGANVYNLGEYPRPRNIIFESAGTRCRWYRGMRVEWCRNLIPVECGARVIDLI